jgi:hypothetical protein
VVEEAGEPFAGVDGTDEDSLIASELPDRGGALRRGNGVVLADEALVDVDLGADGGIVGHGSAESGDNGFGPLDDHRRVHPVAVVVAADGDRAEPGPGVNSDCSPATVRVTGPSSS